MVGVVLFGSNVTDRLSPSCDELPVSNDNFTRIRVLLLANVG